MLKTGNWYTAGSLAAEFGITSHAATGYLYNLRQAKRYETEETPLPGRKVRVVAIAGRKRSSSALWNLALGVKAA